MSYADRDDTKVIELTKMNLSIIDMKEILKKIVYTARILYFKCFEPVYHSSVDFSDMISRDVSLKYSTLGRYNYVAKGCSMFNVRLGNYCCVGPDVHIGGMQHSYWWYSMSPLLSKECKFPEHTVVGNDVWIGAQAIIKQGVKIGNGAVIGANSFVNKDVEPFSIVVGSPARHIKYRFNMDICHMVELSNYWDKNPDEAKEILNSLNNTNRVC